MNKIAIIGGTGLVGSQLAQVLTKAGKTVVIFSRSKHSETKDDLIYARWDPDKKAVDTSALKDIDALVNLAGAGIADKRWTNERKKEIVDSRVDATSFLVEQLEQHAPNCKTFIAASATGYYGPDREGRPFVETDPPYNDFLAQVCIKWEAASREAERLYRTVILRFGIVLGKESGAYPELTGPMKFGVVPILGSGRQMVSWIHLDDLATLIASALNDERYKGTYNAVSPGTVSHRDLMQAIARAKGGIKVHVPVPPFALKVIMGEASIEVLKSCTASANKVMNEGFTFKYPDIDSAAIQLAGK